MFKDTLREIKKSLGRFISLFAICFIGVAFFAGLTASSGDMKNSSDLYYDDYNLCDIEVMSSIGFTSEDINKIQEIDGIQGIYPTCRTDAVTVFDGVQSTLRILTVPDGNYNPNNSNYINQLRLKEGRLPENDHECVIKYSDFASNKIKIGDTLVVNSGTDDDICDTLYNNTYEVVGMVYSPYYVSYHLGSSNVGSGKLDFVMYVYDSCFLSDLYTDVFITVKGAKDQNCYSDKYKEIISPVTDALESISFERLNIRLDDIIEELDSNRKELSDKYEQYPLPALESAIKEIDENKEEFNEKRKDWEWYILDRESQYSFMDYKSSADKMNNIAMVFPVFFILVAALCCLTTMTRMVDEQRETIGTYKALGYSKLAIAMKNVAYSLIASLTGGFFGCIFGLKVFPYIIYNCWNIIYYLPPIRYGKHMVISIVSVVSMTGTIVLATIYSCIYALREVPASLMRPKSPKNGKKIFLEHIGFIWNRLNFSSKVTARNILRYKKRFFMTVVGVAGGCALMYAGFAIKDSISALIKKQFEEIIKYDLSINYETDDAKKEVISNPKLTNSIVISEYTGMASSSDNSDSDVYKEKDNVYIDVTDDTELFMDYITLRKRNTKIVYQLDNEGVCVTEKLAKDLGLKEGNIIYIQGKDLTVKGFKISHIVEMYSNSYIYMTSGLYSQVFGSDPEYNTIYAMVNNVDNETEKNLGREIMDIDGVKGTIFQISNVSTFLDMISTMNLVTYILVISAAALSFVVLYNLTNVNVSERIREIATIKVLGFYDNEVASYVYRENIIISVIGAFAGLFLGMALHNYIMITLEMENIMFGNAVRPVSFVLSFVITVAFSLFVNITMYGKLKRIPMVESLKAVE